MTDNLNAMVDLRDVQVALDVAKRAEMGWFDVEFTMYGCAYWNGRERYYRISASDEKIYDFIEEGAAHNVLPTDICLLSQKYPVPTGMREYIALDVKKDLALEMAEKFPQSFFVLLEQLALEATDDGALSWLLTQQKQLSGCFDTKKIQRFQAMTDYAYTCRKLTRQSYIELKKWIAEEKKSMMENIIAKDIFEKTFYAIAYVENNQLKFVINARRGYIYQKKYALELQGFFVSPVYSETYYYNYTIRLPQIRQMFENEARAYLNADYMVTLKAIFGRNDQLTPTAFLAYRQKAAREYGASAEQTLLHYGYRWGIL